MSLTGSFFPLFWRSGWRSPLRFPAKRLKAPKDRDNKSFSKPAPPATGGTGRDKPGAGSALTFPSRISPIPNFASREALDRLDRDRPLRRSFPGLLRNHAVVRRGPDGGRDRAGRRTTPRRSPRTRSWPPGDFNLPRPLVTGKAFLEDEVVFSDLSHEAREGLDSIGGQDRLRAALRLAQYVGGRRPLRLERAGLGPASWTEPELGREPRRRRPGRQAGLYFQPGTGIDAERLRRAHPSRRGTGPRAPARGRSFSSRFWSFGQILPADFFVQAQAGLEIPFNGTGGERGLPPGRLRQELQLQALRPALVADGRDPGRQGARLRGKDRLRHRAPDSGDPQQDGSTSGSTSGSGCR